MEWIHVLASLNVHACSRFSGHFFSRTVCMNTHLISLVSYSYSLSTGLVSAALELPRLLLRTVTCMSEMYVRDICQRYRMSSFYVLLPSKLLGSNLYEWYWIDWKPAPSRIRSFDQASRRCWKSNPINRKSISRRTDNGRRHMSNTSVSVAFELSRLLLRTVTFQRYRTYLPWDFFIS